MKIQLKPGREKPLRQRHPWVFSGAIAKEPGKGTDAGTTVEVVDSAGKFLGRGSYNSQSQIRVRIFSWLPDEKFDEALVIRRVATAVRRRSHILSSGFTNAVRIIFSESDELPGVIADLYGRVVVLQLLTAGADRLRSALIAALKQALPEVRGIYERSDDHSRELEGLAKVNQVLFGDIAESGKIEVLENGMRFFVDVRHGHKTGFYIDQRTSREFVRLHVKNLRVLNCFCYTGGFSIAAALGDAAEVVSVDSSGPALALARENAALNGIPDAKVKWVEADVFEFLRDLKQSRDLFDVIVLDPPKFAHNTGQLNRATRGYKDLIMNGLQLLRPGGRLAAFSCSGLVTEDLFQKVAFGAALDAKVNTQLLNRFMQSEDHPVLLTFPESLYLKGLWLGRD